ncbi:MAG: restriction endonuclease [Candidatus Sumerlaeota bacterium]|nr:restriction endonuclease [Candidatus Sumerlaeota bacterium]
MQDINLSELGSPSAFEKLCSDLLVAEGCQNVRGIGVGADGGRDILADIPMTSPVTRHTETFMVQCKWYAAHRSISVRELTDAYMALPVHHADGLLFIASCSFSGAAVTKAEALDRDANTPYRVKLWDGNEIVRCLRKHPVLIAKYWYGSPSRSSRANSVTTDTDSSCSSRGGWAEIFSTPTLFKDVTIETFPRTPPNESVFTRLAEHATSYGKKPPLVLLITGAVGSGKTGYAYALLNERAVCGASVASVFHDMFNSLFYSYALEGDDKLPSALAYLWNVDYLLLDDYGLDMNDKSQTQVRAAETLIAIVQTRVQAEKPTLITVADCKGTGPTLRKYLAHLKGRFPVVFCGTEDLRHVCEKPCYEEANINTSRDSEATWKGGRWLGRDWLSEKMSIVEDGIEEAIGIVVAPEDEFVVRQKLFKERYGYNLMREQEILGILEDTRDRLRGLRSFVESFSFHAVREDDGGVHLEP